MSLITRIRRSDPSQGSTVNIRDFLAGCSWVAQVRLSHLTFLTLFHLGIVFYKEIFKYFVNGLHMLLFFYTILGSQKIAHPGEAFLSVVLNLFRPNISSRQLHTAQPLFILEQSFWCISYLMQVFVGTRFISCYTFMECLYDWRVILLLGKEDVWFRYFK